MKPNYKTADSGIRFPYAVRINGLMHRPFIFIIILSNSNSEHFAKPPNWRSLKHNEGKDKRIIPSQFRIPAELHQCQFECFKVYLGINRYKLSEFAMLLVKALKCTLSSKFVTFREFQILFTWII